LFTKPSTIVVLIASISINSIGDLDMYILYIVYIVITFDDGGIILFQSFRRNKCAIGPN
jgi:hypothetical protein